MVNQLLIPTWIGVFDDLPTQWPVVPGFMELLHCLILQMYLQETINNLFMLSYLSNRWCFFVVSLYKLFNQPSIDR